MNTLRITLLACLMLMTAVCSWAETPKTAERQPLISVEEPVYTFPEVLDGKKVVHDFIIKNKGAAVLKIDHVDST